MNTSSLSETERNQCIEVEKKYLPISMFFVIWMCFSAIYILLNVFNLLFNQTGSVFGKIANLILMLLISFIFIGGPYYIRKNFLRRYLLFKKHVDLGCIHGLCVNKETKVKNTSRGHVKHIYWFSVKTESGEILENVSTDVSMFNTANINSRILIINFGKNENDIFSYNFDGL